MTRAKQVTRVGADWSEDRGVECMDESKQRNGESRASESSPPNPEKRGKKKQKFEPPKVITYSGDDILEELGPAHACNPFSGAVVAC